MGIVTGQVIDPAGNPQPGVLVRISISTADGTPALGPGGNSIIVPVSTSADPLGNWSLSLIPNSQITPAASEYSVTEGNTTPYFIVVPDGAGPTAVNSIRTAPPMTPTSGEILAINVRVASGSGLAATNVQGALAELKTDIGTGGAGVEVTSHKGAANGYAALDGTTHVPVAQLPVIPATDISVAAGAGVTATQVQAAILELHNAIGSGGTGVELTAHKDAANGYPSLDNTGKILVSELPVIPASDISVSAITGVTSTTVQAAIGELYGDIQSISAGSSGAPGVGVPVGGALHQILRKKTTADYDTEWANATGLPAGGTSGQVLAKLSATDFDFQWQTDTATTAGVSVYPFFVIAPGDSWAAALAAHPTMTTFIIKAGVHSQVFLTLTSGVNDHLRFIGEPGAIVDGAMVKRTITNVFSHANTSITSTANPFTSADVSATTPTTIWGGLTFGFANNIGSNITALVTSGSVTVDDPAQGGAADGPFTCVLTRPPQLNCDHFLTGNATDIWIRNLEIRNFATPRNRAAIHPMVGDDTTQRGMKWIIEDCLVHDNANEGARICDAAIYRRCKMYNNGDIGLCGVGLVAEIDNCEVYGNNAYNNAIGFDASGMKFALTVGLKVHDCLVHDNSNNGIWCDVDCQASDIYRNLVWNNTGCGIIVETSYHAYIHENACWSNGPAVATGSFFDGCAQILISASSDIEICYNEIGKVGTTNKFGGIGVLYQDRMKGTISRTITDGSVSGTALTSTSQGAFRTGDAGALITYAGQSTPIHIESVTGGGAATLETGGATISGGTITISRPQTIYGNTTKGQSGLRQRSYNISIHHNAIRVEAGALACGMQTDTTVSAQVFYEQNIRWWSNFYDVDPSAFLFAIDNGAQNLAYWHGRGMDTYVTVPTPTPNQGSYWLAPTETIMPAGDQMGVQATHAMTKAQPLAFWVASTAYSGGQQVRPASPNGFIYQVTTGGTAGGSAPTWGTTVGGSTTDGGVTWRNLGVDPSTITGAAVVDLSLGLVQTLFLSGNVTGWTVTNLPSMVNAEVEISFVNGATANTLGAASGSNIAHDAATSPAAPTASHRRTTRYRSDGLVLRQSAPSVLTAN